MNEPGTQESLSRKEREKLARQQDILKAARELFAQKGFRDTTLDEIAQKAEFGKGTLYNYFASKEDIFHAIIDQAIDSGIAMARACVSAPGDVRSRLITYARKNMLYIRENGELLHAIFHELHSGRKAETSKLQDIVERSRTVTGIIATLLKEEMDRGVFLQGDPEQLVILLDDMVRGYAGRKTALQGTLNDEEIDQAATRIVSILLDGISARNSKG